MDGVIDYMASKAEEGDKERVLALKNVGPLHYICTGPPIRGAPHPSQDLIKLYRLTDLAESLRRNDPVTQAKISKNKLRSSYKGKLKEMGILGRNEAPENPGMWVPNMTMVPEDDWVNTIVRGKMPETVTAAPDWSRKLRSALEMAPGKLPPDRENFYRGFVAMEDTNISKTIKPPNGIDPVRRAAIGAHPHTTPPSPAKGVRRPERSGAKRSYGDSSFSGYAEGFVDDEDGTDTDGPLGHRKKKQRREYSAATSPMAGPSNSFRSFT